MADDSGLGDKNLDTLDLIMKSLQEHEKAVDELIDALKTYTQSIPNFIKLEERIDSLDQNIDSLQKQIADLSIHAKVAKDKITALHSSQKAMESVGEIATTLSIEVPLIVRCQQWNEFKMLALQAQVVSFSYQEDKKMIEVSALKGKQLIIYSCDFSNPVVDIRAYLSSTLEMGEHDIFKGSVETSK